MWRAKVLFNIKLKNNTKLKNRTILIFKINKTLSWDSDFIKTDLVSETLYLDNFSPIRVFSISILTC